MRETGLLDEPRYPHGCLRCKRDSCNSSNNNCGVGAFGIWDDCELEMGNDFDWFFVSNDMNLALAYCVLSDIVIFVWVCIFINQ